MVTPDQAAQLCRVTTRTIYRRIEAGRLHFTETEKGFSLICLQSLESNANSARSSSDDAASPPLKGFLRTSVNRMLKRD
jgi:excisionase family DNA binding protein